MNVRWTAQHTEQLRQLCAETPCPSNRQLGKILGWNHSTISRRRKQMGVIAVRRVWSIDDDIVLRKLCADNPRISDRRLSEMLGWEHSTINNHRRRLQITARKRRTLTKNDIAMLCKLVAENKWSDNDLAYMLGFCKRTIEKWRHNLGLPATGGKGGGQRNLWAPETRAKVGASVRQRWQDPAYRAQYLPQLAAAGRIAYAKRFRAPPRGTPEYNLYRKFCRGLGVERAREEWCKITAKAENSA